VAQIIERFSEPFVARYLHRLSTHVENTLLRIGFCRTPPMGGRIYQCPRCDARVPLYNSCADRHCPTCRGARRAAWVDKAAELLHPAATYFQVVFTIPDTLSSLVLGNRRALYQLLFHSAWQALRDSMRDECGIEAAATMVLHTWNQRLEHHAHVHALVPGSGPALDGESWIPCRQTRATRSRPAKPFLVDNRRLGHRFRDAFLAGLDRLRQTGKLRLRETDDVQSLVQQLADRDWVVFIEPPPNASCSPEQVLKYLARYMTGGPISDRRLIGIQSGQVSFWARSTDKTKARQQVPVTLPGVEFMRRWCLHILPKGFTKVRCYGGWSNTRRDEYRRQCQRLAPVSRPEPRQSESPAVDTREEPACRACPRCQAPMELISSTVRPRWRELFYGPDHPRWLEWIGAG